ncbi:MAG: sigma-70 family RNA polymerase sigma factor [Bacteroidota bacterium]
MVKDKFQIQLLGLEDKLYRMALSIVFDKDLASDMTQEALMILWERRRKLRNTANFEAYAVTVIKNLCLDVLRREKFFEENILPQLSESKKFYGVNYAKKDEIGLLFNLLEKVNAEHRLIFVMKTIEGYSYEEISMVTKLKHDNLRKIVSRVRQGLRNSLKILNNEKRNKDIAG